MSFGCWSYWSYEEDMIVLMIGHVFWKHDPCHNGNHKKHETLQNQITSWSHTPQQGHLLSVVGLILQSCISTLHFATLHKITRWSHTPQEGHFLSVPQQPITASSSAETLTDNTITAPGTPTLQPTTPTIPPYQKEIRFGDKTNRSQNRFILTGLDSVRTHQIPTSSLRWLDNWASTTKVINMIWFIGQIYHQNIHFDIRIIVNWFREPVKNYLADFVR